MQNNLARVLPFSPDVEQPTHIKIESKGMDYLRIQGGKALNGAIPISGAKNAALKLMCAALLSRETLRLANMPNGLRDIASQTDLLRHLGCTIEMAGDRMALNAATVHELDAPYDLVRKMRTSILVLGPLLARFHEARVSLPGGCAIGTRPIDFHLDGLRALGAVIELANGYITAKAPGGLQGAHYNFPKVSHTATENVMMAATLARGETILSNAAQEPGSRRSGRMPDRHGRVYHRPRHVRNTHPGRRDPARRDT